MLRAYAMWLRATMTTTTTAIKNIAIIQCVHDFVVQMIKLNFLCISGSVCMCGIGLCDWMVYYFHILTKQQPGSMMLSLILKYIQIHLKQMKFVCVCIGCEFAIVRVFLFLLMLFGFFFSYFFNAFTSLVCIFASKEWKKPRVENIEILVSVGVRQA